MLFDIPAQKVCKKIVSTFYMYNLEIIITKKSLPSRQSSSLYTFSMLFFINPAIASVSMIKGLDNKNTSNLLIPFIIASNSFSLISQLI